MTDTLRMNRRGVIVTCATCGFQKQPIGRSAPLYAYYCTDECKGYGQRPLPGSLWPGESEADFGYPVGANGTTDAQVVEASEAKADDQHEPRAT